MGRWEGLYEVVDVDAEFLEEHLRRRLPGECLLFRVLSAPSVGT